MHLPVPLQRYADRLDAMSAATLASCPRSSGYGLRSCGSRLRSRVPSEPKRAGRRSRRFNGRSTSDEEI